MAEYKRLLADDEQYLTKKEPRLDESKQKNPDDLKTGLSVLTAGIFIVAEIAGAGVLALPKALAGLRFPGLLAFGFAGALLGYAGLLLGKSWMIALRETAKLSDEPIRDPYPAIGERAYGKLGRAVVLILLCSHGFLASVVYVIMPSEMMSHIFHVTFVGMTESESIRIWIMIFILIVVPLTWFDSPKDNWFIAVVASVSTAIGVICILCNYVLLSKHSQPVSSKIDHTFFTMVNNLAVSFGIFVAAFTGAVVFPTVQTDMKEPEKFSKSLLIGYSGCVFVYAPVMIGGFVIFDQNVKSNVLLSLTSVINSIHHAVAFKVLVFTAVSCFVAHFVSATIIQVNPVVQLIEGYLKVPAGFHWKRCFLRTCFMLAVVAFAEAVPNFEPILSFLGGTVNMYLSVAFPAAFYLGLRKDVGSLEKVVIYIVIAMALFLSGVIGFINGSRMINIMWNTKKSL